MLSVDGRLREILPLPSALLNPHLFIYSSIHPPTHSFSFPLCVSVESDMRSLIPQSPPPHPPSPVHHHHSFTSHTVAKDMSFTFMFFHINHMLMQKNGGIQLYLSLCGRYVKEVSVREEPPFSFSSSCHYTSLVYHPVILTLKLFFSVLLTQRSSTGVFFFLSISDPSAQGVVSETMFSQKPFALLQLQLNMFKSPMY